MIKICTYVCIYVCMYVCVSYGLHLFTSDKNAIKVETIGAPDKRGSSSSEVWRRANNFRKVRRAPSLCYFLWILNS